jgi:polar amino acid transport system substrate-binding protein
MFKSAATKTALVISSLALAVPALSACGTSSAASSDSTSAKLQTPAIIKSGRLTVCSTDSPPNIYHGHAGDLVGIEIDVAKAIAQKLGLEPELHEYAFSGLIPALQASQCDVIMGSLYIKPEREKIANFVPYLLSGTAVAVSSKNPKNITGFDESLCGAKVAAINGATGATLLTEKIEDCKNGGHPGVEVTLVNEGSMGLQQVSAGQVDAFVDTSSMISFYANKADSDFKMVGKPFGTIKIGAATLKDKAELHEALSGAFDEIVKEGKYDEILKAAGMETEDIRKG